MTAESSTTFPAATSPAPTNGGASSASSKQFQEASLGAARLAPSGPTTPNESATSGMKRSSRPPAAASAPSATAATRSITTKWPCAGATVTPRPGQW